MKLRWLDRSVTYQNQFGMREIALQIAIKEIYVGDILVSAEWMDIPTIREEDLNKS